MPPRVLQVSTANVAFQRLDVLQRNRTKRHRYGEFVVEGVRAINGALAAGWTAGDGWRAAVRRVRIGQDDARVRPAQRKGRVDLPAAGGIGWRTRDV